MKLRLKGITCLALAELVLALVFLSGCKPQATSESNSTTAFPKTNLSRQLPEAKAEPAKPSAVFKFNGKNYELAEAADFVQGYQAGKRMALSCRLANHTNSLQTLFQACHDNGADPSQVFNPSEVYCRQCSVQVPMSVLMRYLMPGMSISAYGRSDTQQWTEDKCPHCGSEDFVLLSKAKLDAGQGWTKTDQDNMVRYYRYLAKLWWSQQTGNKICDSCNSEVRYGDGYILGRLRNGRQLYSSRLYCDDCIKSCQSEEFLQKLQENPDYAGSGLLEEVREWASSQ